MYILRLNLHRSEVYNKEIDIGQYGTARGIFVHQFLGVSSNVINNQIRVKHYAPAHVHKNVHNILVQY